jgi:hypothetical protein
MFMMKTCPIKQNTQTKGELKKIQDGRTQVLANKETSKDGKKLTEQGQLKYPNPPLVVRSISDKERGKNT